MNLIYIVKVGYLSIQAVQCCAAALAWIEQRWAAKPSAVPTRPHLPGPWQLASQAFERKQQELEVELWHAS
jgi:hypothetical protein